MRQLAIRCAVGNALIKTVMKTIRPFYVAIPIALMFTTYIPAVLLTVPSLPQ